MDLQEKNIKELLISSQAGDKESYGEFLAMALIIIRKMTSKKIFNPGDREDVTQDALLGLHKSLNTYDSSRSCLSWIKAITHYKIVDYIRKVSKIQENEQITDEGDVTIFGAPANDYLETMEIFSEIPDSLKGPIILTKIKGYSTAEAAEMLQIKESALRTRVSRGIKLLKKKLEDENYEQ
jgi:RNA polymerase sigma-70 factor, ECF subfamily